MRSECTHPPIACPYLYNQEQPVADEREVTKRKFQGFGSAFFLADPDLGKNLHADPDPGGIRGRGLGVKGKNEFLFLSFFHVSDDS